MELAINSIAERDNAQDDQRHAKVSHQGGWVAIEMNSD